MAISSAVDATRYYRLPGGASASDDLALSPRSDSA
jgi:hypothetical protein